MRRLLFILILLAISAIASATDVHGPVSGTWTTAGSPYNVIGEINLPAGQTLVIEPGVQVLFQGHFKFKIFGCLQAVGTPEDSILFTSTSISAGFWGLRFYDLNTQSDSSRLVYCHISYGVSSSDNSAGEDKNGGAIYASHSNKLLISHCLIVDNHTANVWGANGTDGASLPGFGYPGGPGGHATSGHGGAVYLDSSNVRILSCVFYNNSTGNATGGNGGNGGNTLPQTFPSTANGGDGGTGGNGTAGNGGALYCLNSTPELVNNVFQNNHTGIGTGGWGGAGGNASTAPDHNAYGGDGGNGGMGKGGLGGVCYAVNISYNPNHLVNNLLIENHTGNGSGGSGGHGGNGMGGNWQYGTEGLGGWGGNGGNGYGGNGAVNFLVSGYYLAKNTTAAQNHCGSGNGGTGGTGGQGSSFGGGLGSSGSSTPGIAVFDFTSNATLQMSSSIIWNNPTQVTTGQLLITYSCIQSAIPGTGNIYTDPLFTSLPRDDYYLSQLGAGQPVQSPCVDTGCPDSSMISGTTRTDGLQDSVIVDMGFHHPYFTPQAILVVSPYYLLFEAAWNGPNPPSQTSYINNLGSTSLSFQAQSSAGWLTVAPQSGGPITPGMHDSIAVSVNTAGMPVGVYWSNFIVTAPGAVGSPDTTPVCLSISQSALTLSPDSLSFAAAVNQSNLISQTFVVQNTGAGTLQYQVAENCPWLSVTPMSGGPVPPTATERVTVNAESLNIGNYHADIIVTSPWSLNSPDTMEVQLMVGYARLSLSTNSLTFNAAFDTTPPPQTFSISNLGVGSLSYSIQENIDWLNVSPLSGGPIPPTAQETVSVNMSGLSFGTYTGDIIVTSPNGLGSPDTIHVTLDYSPPVLSVVPDSMSFNIYQGETAPSQSLIINNAGPGYFNYTLSTNVDWLNIQYDSGYVPPADTIAVIANCSSLTPGTYTGDIIVTALNVPVDPDTVRVTLTLVSGYSGSLTGILSAGVYNITGTINVPAYDTLEINPGATLLFRGPYEFNVDGLLKAIGTETDSIVFKPFYPNTYWEGLKFNVSASDSCTIKYCLITRSNASGISIFNSYSAISNCAITHNRSSSGGGVYYHNYSGGLLEQCRVEHDSASLYGGGIYCGPDTRVSLSGNLINACASTTGIGGGIYVKDASTLIGHNQLINNSAQNGGGIATFGSGSVICRPVINYNLIYGNTVSGAGGGLSIGTHTIPHLINNTITQNYHTGPGNYGGGIAVSYDSIYIQNCIIYDNTAPQIFYYSGITPLEVTYSDIQDSLWLGEGNIDADPLFLAPDSGDFHLTAASPCIDAGDPSSPFDQDSTVADMGAFYFDQTQGIVPGKQLQLPTCFALNPVYPNPFNPATEVNYQLPATSQVSLRVYDTVGRLVATLVEGWRPAGVHEVTFEGSRLSSGLYFVRMQAGSYTAVQKMVLMK